LLEITRELFLFFLTVKYSPVVKCFSRYGVSHFKNPPIVNSLFSMIHIPLVFPVYCWKLLETLEDTKVIFVCYFLCEDLLFEGNFETAKVASLSEWLSQTTSPIFSNFDSSK